MLVNELSRPEDGIVVYRASQETQLARENPAWGHGAFTLALLEVLGGQAPTAGDAAAAAALLRPMCDAGRVTVAGLNHYLSERVRALTRGQQQTGLGSPERTLPSDTPLAYLPKD